MWAWPLSYDEGLERNGEVMKTGEIWKKLSARISVLLMGVFLLPVQVRADVIDDSAMHYGNPEESAVAENIVVICGVIIVVILSVVVLRMLKKRKEEKHIADVQKMDAEKRGDEE